MFDYYSINMLTSNWLYHFIQYWMHFSTHPPSWSHNAFCLAWPEQGNLMLPTFGNRQLTTVGFAIELQANIKPCSVEAAGVWVFKIAPWTRLHCDKCCPLPSQQQSEDTMFSRLSPLIYLQPMVTTVYCEPNQATQSCHMSHGKEGIWAVFGEKEDVCQHEE